MMKTLGILAVAGAAGSALAQTNDVQVMGFNGPTHRATLKLATGEVFYHDGFDPRFGPATAWDNTTQSGFYTNRASGLQQVVDWGDVANNTIVNGFQIGYATNSAGPVDLDIAFYGDENGYADVSTTLATYGITGLAGSVTGGLEAWIYDIDLTGLEFTVTGSDLDADGLADFGFGYRVANNGGGTSVGPLITSGGVGNVDAFDRYGTPGQNLGGAYQGTFFFGGAPFAGFHMKLYTLPTPGALALLGLGGLVAGRRRR